MAIVQKPCKVCLIEGVESYEIQYLDRTITSSQVMERLGIESSWSWRNHINNHVRPQVAIQLADRSDIVDHVVDKIGETILGLEDVKEVLANMKKRILDNPDPAYLKTYLQALAELRHYIESLQKLQGDFKESSKVNVQNMHIEYVNLTGQILQDACPKCRTKFAETLRPILKKADVSNETRSDL